MKTKQFFLYSIIYIGIVVAIVFFHESESYVFNILGINLNLPIALWFAIPLIIYMCLAIFHIAYHSFSFYRTKRAIAKDLSSYDAMTKEVLLGLDSNKDFKTEFFKDPSDVTKVLSPWYDSTGVNIQNEELKEILNLVERVKNGEVVELKKYKLPKTNGLFLQNELNRLDANDSYAKEILNSKEIYNDEIVKKAYNLLLKTQSFLEIKKYEIPKDIEDINILLNRISDEKFEIAKEDLFGMLNNQNFSEQNFIDFAKKLKNTMSPESYKAFFEKLKDENSNATEAYLYVLYELGMIDALREQLSLSDGDEHDKFDILLFLKDHGKNVPASLIF